MPKHSRSVLKVKNPYRYLVLNVFLQAFRDINAYLMNDGTAVEKEEGKKSIRWMKRMEGSFRTLAGSTGMSLETFHQLCLDKITEMKLEAYEKRKVLEENKKSPEGRKRNLEMGKRRSP